MQRRALVVRSLLFFVYLLVACGGIVSRPSALDYGTFGDCGPTGDPAKITPYLSCIDDEGTARTYVFGYRNDGSYAVVPSGPANQLVPELAEPLVAGTARPPSTFAPGDHPAAFATQYPSVLEPSWVVGARTTAGASAPACVRSTTADGRALSVPGENAAGIVVERNTTGVADRAIVPTLRPLNGQAVGQTTGTLQVADDGAANYSVPLWVPPGRAGMQPELALTYSSRAGNGLIGVGWSLTGLSQIARCPKTLETASIARPVRFDDSDQLCVDGDPLVGDLRLGAHPLHDPYTRVRAAASDAFGPSTIVVELRNGRILDYGGEATIEGIRSSIDEDGQEQGGGQYVRLAWMLARTRDRNGNRIDYHYEDLSSTAQGDCQPDPARWMPCFAYEKRLASITYTHGPGALDAAQRAISFQYEARPDTDLAYVAGFAVKRTGRLLAITETAPAPITPAAVHSYEFAYDASSVSGRSRLSSITECDGGGACKLPTRFEYERGDETFAETQVIASLSDVPDLGISGMATGDFNGDGVDDLLFQIYPSGWNIRWGKTTSAYSAPVPVSLPAQVTGPGKADARQPYAADVDQDGRAELIWPTIQFTINETTKAPIRSDSTVIFKWSDAAGAFVRDSSLPTNETIYADLLGDGRQTAIDIGFAGPEKGQWEAKLTKDVLLSDAPPPIENPPYTVPVFGSLQWSLLIARDDRYEIASLASRSAALPSQRTFLPTGRPFWFSDFDGDGTADVLATVPVNDYGTGAVLGVATGVTYKRFTLGNTPNPNGFLAGNAIALDRRESGNAGWLVAGDVVGAYMLESAGVDAPIWSSPPPLLRADGSAVTWSAPDVSGFRFFARVLDANGDGLQDLILADGGSLRLFTRQGKRADLLTAVHLGLGDLTTISHSPHRVAAFASDDAACSYPVTCGQRGMWGVETVTRHVQLASGHRTTSYSYEAPMADVRTGAFLGFGTVTERDVETGAVTTMRYARRGESFADDAGRLHFPYGHALTSLELRQPSISGTYVTQTLTSYELAATLPADAGVFEVNSTRPFVIHVSATESHAFVETPTGAKVLSNNSSTLQYDDYGNVVVADEVVADLATSDHRTFGWRNDTAAWLLGQPTTQTTTSTVATHSTSRTTNYETDPATGLIRATTVYPDVPALRLTTRVIRDVAGNVTTQTIADATGQTRRWDYTYDDSERLFVGSITDPMGYVTRTVMHPALGVLVQTTDANEVSRSWRYDGFGRMREAVRPSCVGTDKTGKGCSGTSSFLEEIASAIDGAAYAVRVTELHRPTRTTHYDTLGRVVREEATAFDAKSLRRRLTSYDAIHSYEPSQVSIQVAASSGPGGDGYRTTSFSYDTLGRPTKVTEPNGAVRTYVYNARRTLMQDEAGDVSYEDYDELGRVVRAARLADSELVTHLAYGPFGVIRQIVDPRHVVTTFGYDDGGRRVRQFDPNSGEARFGYSAFGELTYLRDAVGNETVLGYDLLGRLIGERAPDGDTCYQYDAGQSAVGLPTRAKRHDVYGSAAHDVEESWDYDLLGRVIRSHLRVDDEPDHAVETVYRSDDGSVGEIDFPDVVGHHLAFTYGQTAAGYIESISAGGTDPQLLWREDSETLAGEITQQTFGNGIVSELTRAPDTGWLTREHARTAAGVSRVDLDYRYYPDGRLARRSDHTIPGPHAIHRDRTDKFVYDGAKRLSEWSGSWGAVNYQYDDSGNLSSRTTKKPAASLATETFVSGPAVTPPGPASTPEPPHAIIQGPSGSYAYDAAGRETSAAGRTIEWTSFGLPRRIATDASETLFIYGPHKERVRRIDASTGETTTYVLGNVYEVRKTADHVEHVYSVAAPTGASVQIAWTESKGAFVDSRVIYVHSDVTASPVVLTDASGAEIDHIAREPFGRRVGLLDPTILSTSADAVADVRVGIAGHELDADALVNMGGRIYDPSVGRFLSADPVLGGNRYAYVSNDPINGRDPFGLDDNSGEEVPAPKQGSDDGDDDNHGGYGPGDPTSPSTPGGPKGTPPVFYAPSSPALPPPVYTPLNTGVGAASPKPLAPFIGFGVPTIGAGYRLAGGGGFGPSFAPAPRGPVITTITSEGIIFGAPRVGTKLTPGLFQPHEPGVGESDSWWHSTTDYVAVHGDAMAMVPLRFANAASQVGLMMIGLGYTQGGVWATEAGIVRPMAGAAPPLVGSPGPTGAALPGASSSGTAAAAAATLGKASEKCEDHHCFPEAMRAEFWRRFAINIDEFTIRLPALVHRAIHSAPKDAQFMGGGWWNADWRMWLDANPNADPFDAKLQMWRMLIQYELTPYLPIGPYGGPYGE